MEDGRLLILKKKWLAIIGVVMLVSIFATVAFAGNPIKLIVNGREIKPDVPPQIINGRTMVPVRWVAEAVGANVNWNKEQKVVRIDFGSLSKSLQQKWEYPYPSGGELSLGYLGRQAKFLLPVITTLNNYLAEQQKESLFTEYTDQGNQKQSVLVRYEILNAGRTDGGMWYTDETAYEIVARLYYSEVQNKENHPPYVIRLYEQKDPNVQIQGVLKTFR